MSSRIGKTFTRAVHIPPVDKAQVFQRGKDWYWELTTLEDERKTRGPFSTRGAAREDRKKYAEKIMKQQRKG